MKEEAADPFVEASRSNPGVLQVNLKSNDLNRESLQKLDVVLKRNHKKRTKELVPKHKQTLSLIHI